MTYDPFARGAHPVGVHTFSVVRGARLLPVEVWYPAAARHAGHDTHPERRDTFAPMPGFPPVPQDAVRDAEPEGGRHPLVVFSHGYGGHRRQSTFLCTHLASHGYVVAAVDHTGNTVVDVVQQMLATLSGGPRPDPTGTLRAFVEHRPEDARDALDAVLAHDLGRLADPTAIGMAGHSFGGWTTLVATARDRRIRAALPLAPAGGETHLPADMLVERVEVDFGRDVPTTFIAADRDSLLPIEGVRALYRRVTGPARLVILQESDHLHFMDRIAEHHELFRTMPQDDLFAGVLHRMLPITALMPEDHAYDAIRGIGLAHFDAALEQADAAAAWLAGDLAARLAARGVRIAVE